MTEGRQHHRPFPLANSSPDRAALCSLRSRSPYSQPDRSPSRSRCRLCRYHCLTGPRVEQATINFTKPDSRRLLSTLKASRDDFDLLAVWSRSPLEGN